MSKTIQFDVLPHQQEMLDSDDFVAALVGGVGCGKSHALGFEIFRWMQTESPRSPILAVAPTHEQLDKSTIARFKTLLGDAGVEFVHGQKPPADWEVPMMAEFKRFTNILTLETGHIVVCASMDEPSTIRGPQYGLALMDELAFVPYPEAFDVVIGRMRCPHTKNHKIRIATSPNGRNWFYYMFADTLKKRPGYKMIRATSIDNTYLNANYLNNMKSYDDNKYRQEVLGEFVDIDSERVYTEFKPDRHIKTVNYDHGAEIHVGMDFNRSPLCWEIAHLVDDHLFIFDQIIIETEATTFDACQTLLSKFPGKHIVVYPDASCRHCTTAGGAYGSMSDMDILVEHGLDVVCPRKNPNIVDRIEAVQEAFRADKITIDPRCQELIDSLLNTAYMPGTRVPKKARKNKEVGEHPSDALGYLVYFCQMVTGITVAHWG